MDDSSTKPMPVPRGCVRHRSCLEIHKYSTNVINAVLATAGGGSGLTADDEGAAARVN